MISNLPSNILNMLLGKENDHQNSQDAQEHDYGHEWVNQGTCVKIIQQGKYRSFWI